jgi:hypothetical protein
MKIGKQDCSGVDKVIRDQVGAQLLHHHIQSRGVVLPNVQLGSMDALLEGGNESGQEVRQHHQRQQALLCQELDPFEHKVISALQIRNLLPEGALAHWVTSRQL